MRDSRAQSCCYGIVFSFLLSRAKCLFVLSASRESFETVCSGGVSRTAGEESNLMETALMETALRESALMETALMESALMETALQPAIKSPQLGRCHPPALYCSSSATCNFPEYDSGCSLNDPDCGVKICVGYYRNSWCTWCLKSLQVDYKIAFFSLRLAENRFW